MKSYAMVILLLLAVLAFCTIWYFTTLNAENVDAESLQNSRTDRTEGNVSFTARTITYNGEFHPRNIGAIWVTTSAGVFVKTLKLWASSSERQNLVQWTSSAHGNVVGAITSATINSHQLHSVTWNCMSNTNTSIADGVYKIWVEYTEADAAGHYTSVSFTKGGGPAHVAPANTAYFSSVVLDYAPFLPPINVLVHRSGSNIVLTWSAVSTATGYKVYSSTNPYSTLAWTLETPTAITALTWTGDSTQQKKFFRVTAQR